MAKGQDLKIATILLLPTPDQACLHNLSTCRNGDCEHDAAWGNRRDRDAIGVDTKETGHLGDRSRDVEAGQIALQCKRHGGRERG